MKRIVLSLVVSLTLAVGLVYGQFFGLTVFDPTVYAEAVAEVGKLVQQYNQLVQTYQMITSQYAQQVDPGAGARRQAAVDDVDTDVLVPEQGIAGADQKEAGIEIPLQLEPGIGALIEDIAHDGVAGAHQHRG